MAARSLVCGPFHFLVMALQSVAIGGPHRQPTTIGAAGGLGEGDNLAPACRENHAWRMRECQSRGICLRKEPSLQCRSWAGARIDQASGPIFGEIYRQNGERSEGGRLDGRAPIGPIKPHYSKSAPREIRNQPD